MSGESSGACEVCKQPTVHKCSGCKLVYYCTPEHQKDHWPDHKDKCKCYEVCESPELGKHLKATRDLSVGDLILNEVPLVVGPKTQKIDDGPIPCVGCCRLIEPKYCERCPDCLWPVCTVMCMGLKDISRHGAECRILKLNLPSVMTYTPDTVHQLFRWDILIVLRALLVQKTSKARWQKLVSLEAHQDKRGPGTSIHKIISEKISYLQDTFLTPLKQYEEENKCTVLPDASPDLIHKIYGILDVNAWEVNEDHVEITILYPTASLIEHNCVPNISQSIGNDKENFRITIRSALPIREGEHITSTYTNILWGTHARRKHLKKIKYFSCTCKRCRDPTELGTFFGALKCLGTEGSSCGGIQLPVNPLDADVQWVCDKCKITLPAKEIMMFVDHLGMEVDKVMSRKPSVEELEELLEKLSKFLHGNHFHMYAVKHSLIQLYNSRFTEGVELSDSFLKEKVDICVNLLQISRTLDPGHVRIGLYLGVILHELFDARFLLLTRNYSSDKKDSFLKDIRELSELVKEGKESLKFETRSMAGLNLFKVVSADETKLEAWKQENSITM